MGSSPSSPRSRRRSSSQHSSSSKGGRSSSTTRSSNIHSDTLSIAGEDQHVVKSTLRRIWMISGASIGVVAIIALLLYKDYLLLFVLGFLSCWTLLVVNEMFGSVVNATRSMYQYNFVSKSSSSSTSGDKLQQRQSLNNGLASVEGINDDNNHHSRVERNTRSIGDNDHIKRKLIDQPEKSHDARSLLDVQPHRKHPSSRREIIDKDDESVDFELDISKSSKDQRQQHSSPPGRGLSNKRRSGSGRHPSDNSEHSSVGGRSRRDPFPFLQDIEDPYYANLFGEAINQMKQSLNR